MKKCIALLLTFIMVFTMVFNIIPSIVGLAAKAAEDYPVPDDADVPEWFELEAKQTEFFYYPPTAPTTRLSYDIYVDRPTRTVIALEYVNGVYNGEQATCTLHIPLHSGHFGDIPEFKVYDGSQYGINCNNAIRGTLNGNTIDIGNMSYLSGNDILDTDVATFKEDGQWLAPDLYAPVGYCPIGTVPEQLCAYNGKVIKLPEVKIERSVEFVDYGKYTVIDYFGVTDGLALGMAAASVIKLFVTGEILTFLGCLELLDSTLAIVEGVGKLVDPGEGWILDTATYKYKYKIIIDDCVQYNVEKEVVYIHTEDGGKIHYERFQRKSIHYSKLPDWPKKPNGRDAIGDEITLYPMGNVIMGLMSPEYYVSPYTYSYPDDTAELDIITSLARPFRDVYVINGYHICKDDDDDIGHDCKCDFCGGPCLQTPVMSAASCGYNRVKLTWDPVPNTDGYKVYRSEHADGTDHVEFDVSDSEVINNSPISYIDSGLTAGRRYYYQISSYATYNGDKFYSEKSNAVSAVPALAAPVIRNVTSAGSDSVKLAWEPVEDATGYEVWRATVASGTYENIATLDRGWKTTYEDASVSGGTTYYYKARAFMTTTSNDIYSEFSNVLSFVAPKFSYELNPDNTLTITDYMGSDSALIIPSVIEGKTVTAIGEGAFSYCGAVSITIPNTVTSIGAGAFRYTYGLESITIPNSVTSIGGGAFYGSSITSINLPNNLTEIGINVFNSSKLKKIVIPNSVTSIGMGAFCDCHDLTKITLSNKLVYIGYGAFMRTTGLKSIEIPNSVTSIGEYAFSGSGITSIKLSNKLTAINTEVFSSSKLKSIVLPSKVTNIGDRAFMGCGNLTSVTFSNNVTYIGDHAFMDCSKLKDLLVGKKQAMPKKISYIGSQAFARCAKLKSININTSSAGCIISDWAFTGCTGLTSVVIKNVNSAGGYVFADCVNLKTAEFKNVKSIGAFAFLGCGALNEASISGADTIGMFAFGNCGALKKVSITGSGTIGMQAFTGCNKMTTAKVGAKEIGNWAFAYCGSLKDLTLTGTVTIGDGAFIECKSIKTVKIPKAAKTIGIMAFLNCSKIETVTLPSGLTSIGINAFSACTKLKSITIPGSVTSLGAFAFAGCTNMTKAVIPGSVTAVSPGAFADCTKLKTVQLGNGIQSILEHAFANCTSLSKINKPGTLTFIDPTAFEGAGTSLVLESGGEGM